MVYEKSRLVRGISREALMKEEPINSTGRRIIGSISKCFSMTQSIKMFYHTMIGFH